MNRLNPCVGREQMVPAEMLQSQSRARPSGWGAAGWGAGRDAEQQDGEQGEDDGELGEVDGEQREVDGMGSRAPMTGFLAALNCARGSVSVELGLASLALKWAWRR
jgi:hypothetical protein